MRRWVSLAIICAALVWSSAAGAQTKKRVAVFDFEYATVSDAVSAVFGTNVDVGRGIADLIVDDLVTSGVYSIVERKEIEKILAEQNFSNSDRADPMTAAKLGKILGVDAIVIGSITQFGRDDQTTNVGGGTLGRVAGGFGLGGVSRRQAKAVVAINARLVSPDSAEILAVASGKGESQRSGTSLLGAGGGAAGAGAGYDMSGSNFSSTIMGEAVHEAVDVLARELDENAPRVPERVLQIDGLVADATGDTLILNVGTQAGVKVGDRLQVRRAGRAIRDPATGKVLRRIEETLGEVVITEVDDRSSVGTFKGTSQPEVGDRVVNAPSS